MSQFHVPTKFLTIKTVYLLADIHCKLTEGNRTLIYLGQGKY